MGWGTVFKLTPSNGGWAESVLYSFTGGSDGASPYSDVILDQAGNLYGTTWQGGVSGCAFGTGCGTVYQLTPSGSGWKENTLYSFQSATDGGNPPAGLIFDPSGNLYGATWTDGPGGGGTVFELSPADGSWTFTSLYALNGTGGPAGSLVMDGAGSLYGTTDSDGAHGVGSVFKLTPSNGGWIYTSLYDFTGGSDGYFPLCRVVFDTSGNLYGTTYAGGNNNDCGGYGCGVVWEITP